MGNPYRTYPGVIERGRHLIHLCLRNQPETVGYQFWGHRSLDGAYGDPPGSGVGGSGPVALFQVQRGEGFRSPLLRRTGRGMIAGNIRGTTHAVFDGDDYVAPMVGGSPIPPDDHWLFVRVQENRAQQGLLALPGVSETTVTLNGVLAGDELVIKGIIFQFQAGANNLAGRTGVVGDEFIVGLGADDNAAAANLTNALNDNGDVAPILDAVAPAGSHTVATNVGAPSAVVLIQPEDGTPTLLLGSAGQFTVTSSDAGRIALDADTVAEGRMVWAVDPTNPVLGPVYGIPPAPYFGSLNPAFTLQGTAPSSTGCAAGALPDLSEDLSSAAPRAMHLVFPFWLREVAIRNLSGVSRILVSLGVGQAMRVIETSGTFALTSGEATTKEILLACPDGVAGAAFTLHAVTRTEQ